MVEQPSLSAVTLVHRREPDALRYRNIARYEYRRESSLPSAASPTHRVLRGPRRDLALPFTGSRPIGLTRDRRCAVESHLVGDLRLWGRDAISSASREPAPGHGARSRWIRRLSEHALGSVRSRNSSSIGWDIGRRLSAGSSPLAQCDGSGVVSGRRYEEAGEDERQRDQHPRDDRARRVGGVFSQCDRYPLHRG